LIKLTFTTRKRLEIGDKLCKAQNYLSSNKNCDGLAVVVISGEEFVSQLIKSLGPSQCALSLAKLRLFIFQSIVDRDSGNSIDEVDASLSTQLDPNTIVLHITSYDWIKEQRPNLLPWALIRIFSEAAPTDSALSLLRKVKHFMESRTTETKKVIVLTGN